MGMKGAVRGRAVAIRRTFKKADDAQQRPVFKQQAPPNGQDYAHKTSVLSIVLVKIPGHEG